VGDRRYGSFFIQHPEAGGVLVPNGRDDRWLYGRGWDPEHERLDDYTDACPQPRAEQAGQLWSWDRTLAAWPSALTLCQARSTRPSSSRRKVERRTPTDLRP
jgi:hypothetical protein